MHPTSPDPLLWELIEADQPLPEKTLSPAPVTLVAPVPRLVMYGSVLERSLPLWGRKAWTIGRSLDCAIVIPDRCLSRFHAIVEMTAPGTYVLQDKASLNGSFVNTHKIEQSTLLQNGDHITLGNTNFSFFCPSQPMTNGFGASLAARPITVLMTHASRIQGEIWREILASQGIAVVWVAARTNLAQAVQHLQILGQPPKALLIDLGTTQANPYDFCRWCRDIYPSFQIILISGQRRDVFPSERQWAMRQGASDLLGGFPSENLFGNIVEVAEKLRSVLQVLNQHPVEQSLLLTTLKNLQAKLP